MDYEERKVFKVGGGWGLRCEVKDASQFLSVLAVSLKMISELFCERKAPYVDRCEQFWYHVLVSSHEIWKSLNVLFSCHRAVGKIHLIRLEENYILPRSDRWYDMITRVQVACCSRFTGQTWLHHHECLSSTLSHSWRCLTIDRVSGRPPEVILTVAILSTHFIHWLSPQHC